MNWACNYNIKHVVNLFLFCLTSLVVIHTTFASTHARWRGLVILSGATPLSYCPSYMCACLNMMGAVAVPILPACSSHSVTLRSLTCLPLCHYPSTGCHGPKLVARGGDNPSLCCVVLASMPHPYTQAQHITLLLGGSVG